MTVILHHARGNGPSVKDRILAAALLQERDGAASSTLEQLAVRCWREFPASFGLRGFEDLHPDHYKVAYSLMGKGNLVYERLFASLGRRTYRLTDLGRARAAALLEGRPDVPKEVAALPQFAQGLAPKMLASEVVQSMAAGRSERVEFQHALDMWGVHRGVRGTQLVDHLVGVGRRLREMASQAEEYGAVIDKGTRVTAEQCRLLLNTHRSLLERFERNLRVLGWQRVRNA